MRGASEEVVAVLVSDLHLSHKAPVARSAEPDWYGAMGGYLRQLRDLARGGPSSPGEIPVVCAGDVFDKWNPPPELINSAIANLPTLHAVPGQHDLPNHRYEDKERSAYWTLKEAGKIIDLVPDSPADVPGRIPIRLHGFPWGFPVKPLENPCDFALEVAVIHDYLWVSRTGYVGAPKEKRLKNRRGQFQGYDVAVVGDNHTHFHALSGDCQVWNNGGFMRRKSDERGRIPCVGLLYADGTVERRLLDVSGDRWLEAGGDFVRKLEGQDDCREFVKKLEELDGGGIDFAEAVRRAAADSRPEVKSVVLRVMED